jgi:hypothetical protein
MSLLPAIFAVKTLVRGRAAVRVTVEKNGRRKMKRQISLKVVRGMLGDRFALVAYAKKHGRLPEKGEWDLSKESVKDIMTLASHLYGDLGDDKLYRKLLLLALTKAATAEELSIIARSSSRLNRECLEKAGSVCTYSELRQMGHILGFPGKELEPMLRSIQTEKAESPYEKVEQLFLRLIEFFEIVKGRIKIVYEYNTRFEGKYDQDWKKLLEPLLAEIQCSNLTPDECLELLKLLLGSSGNIWDRKIIEREMSLSAMRWLASQNTPIAADYLKLLKIDEYFKEATELAFRTVIECSDDFSELFTLCPYRGPDEGDEIWACYGQAILDKLRRLGTVSDWEKIDSTFWGHYAVDELLLLAERSPKLWKTVMSGCKKRGDWAAKIAYTRFNEEFLA